MAKPITAFVFCNGHQNPQGTVAQFPGSGLVRKTFLLTGPDVRLDIDECTPLRVDSLFSSDTMRLVATKCTSPYALFILQNADKAQMNTDERRATSVRRHIRVHLCPNFLVKKDDDICDEPFGGNRSRHRVVRQLAEAEPDTQQNNRRNGRE